MGDMADMALDNAFNDMENFDRYSESSLQEQYENGLIDEYGATIGKPYSTPSTFTPAPKGPHGEGYCHECGSSTVERHGRYGKFYGCSTFPKCKGSRGS